MSLTTHEIAGSDAKAMQAVRAALAILYLHGGGYVIGSAAAYRNFVGHIAKQARAATFIADDALAPGQPFPGAPDDLKAAHAGLIDLGYERIAVYVGDAEVLRDDAVRFAKRAEASGLTAEVHVWQGMIHVFPSSFAMLQASASALEDIAHFLAEHLGTQQAARA